MYVTDNPGRMNKLVFPSGLTATCEVPMDQLENIKWNLKPRPVIKEGLRPSIAGPAIIITPPADKKLWRFQCWVQCLQPARGRVAYWLEGQDEPLIDTTSHDLFGDMTDVQPAHAPRMPTPIREIHLTTVIEGDIERNVGIFTNFVQEY